MPTANSETVATSEDKTIKHPSPKKQLTSDTTISVSSAETAKSNNKRQLVGSVHAHEPAVSRVKLESERDRLLIDIKTEPMAQNESLVLQPASCQIKSKSLTTAATIKQEPTDVSTTSNSSHTPISTTSNNSHTPISTTSNNSHTAISTTSNSSHVILSATVTQQPNGRMSPGVQGKPATPLVSLLTKTRPLQSSSAQETFPSQNNHSRVNSEPSALKTKAFRSLLPSRKPGVGENRPAQHIAVKATVVQAKVANLSINNKSNGVSLTHPIVVRKAGYAANSSAVEPRADINTTNLSQMRKSSSESSSTEHKQVNGMHAAGGVQTAFVKGLLPDGRIVLIRKQGVDRYKAPGLVWKVDGNSKQLSTSDRLKANKGNTSSFYYFKNFTRDNEFF